MNLFYLLGYFVQYHFLVHFDEDILNVHIGPGELIAFGNLNLILTLNIDENDLSKYKINWDDINSLKDLKFIRKHHHFSKRY